METVLDASAIAAVVTVLLGFLLKIVAGQFQPVDPDGFRAGFKTRGLAMELVRCPLDVELILGKENKWNREVMRQEQYVDFAFIASYLALFLLTAALLWQSHVPYGKFLAIVVTGCAIVAAVFDVREDIFILRLTKRNLVHDKLQGMIDSCRHSALWKWSLIFTAMVFLSPLFWYGHWKPRHLDFIFCVEGILLVVTSLWGLGFLTRDSAIERVASIVMPIALLALTIILCWAAFQPMRLFCV